MKSMKGCVLAETFDLSAAEKRLFVRQRQKAKKKLHRVVKQWRDERRPWPDFLFFSGWHQRPAVFKGEDKLDAHIAALYLTLHKKVRDGVHLAYQIQFILNEIERLIDPITRACRPEVHLSSVWLKPLIKLYLGLRDYQEANELVRLLSERSRSGVNFPSGPSLRST